MDKTTELSKFIALILRHQPSAAGIELDQHGWANVNDMIDGINATGKFYINRDILDEIVRTDNKQRYAYDESRAHIRARQGHSVKVDVGLAEMTPPEYLWHGTAEKYVEKIDEEGLLPKGRLYVHLSTSVSTARTVGKRHGKPVLYRVRSGEMVKDGFKFYRSENKVWLTEHVPKQYLEKCVEED